MGGIGQQIAELRRAHIPRLTQADLAERADLTADAVAKIEQGKRQASLAALERIAAALGVPTSSLLGGDANVPAAPASVDELEALELCQRAGASDVGEETIGRLEEAVDELARAYPVSQPAELIGRVRSYLGYVIRLIDARKTLAEYKRLLIVGSWLSLLGATLHIDLEQPNAAKARLRTSMDLAKQTDSKEVVAWCLETRAWAALTQGDYASALSLSRVAQEWAPKGSSIAIQATAQEGRSQARLGDEKGTYSALARVQGLVDPLAMPEHPEHHFTYDPNKATAYFGTTLAWLGDPAAEPYAREVISRLDGVGGWPRRVASARIDLGLALLTANKHDEAAALAEKAVESGRIVPSNRWRVLEIVQAVEARGLPEARSLREAYQDTQS